MKLDVTCMRYLCKEDYRVLEAVELGMRNHELVPLPLISSLAKLRHGGIHKFISTLLRYKLVAHANNQYNGYRLSYLGYDILALHTFLLRGIVSSIGSQIGVGKESDIFEAQDENGNDIVLKIHRLGRTSFRSVRRNRDYMAGKSKASWLYMSRLAAIKEFAFMKALYANGFPTPVPFDQNRHVVAMSRIRGFPMAQIKTGKMYGAEEVFRTCIAILRRLLEHGLVHCDFNEFNLMVDDNYNVTLIDFPQMVSTTHPNAEELFQRDIKGLEKFFAMKMGYIPPEELLFSISDVTEIIANLDEEIKAGGFSDRENQELIGYILESSRQVEDEGEELCDSEESDSADDDAGDLTLEGSADSASGLNEVAVMDATLSSVFTKTLVMTSNLKAEDGSGGRSEDEGTQSSSEVDDLENYAPHILSPETLQQVHSNTLKISKRNLKKETASRNMTKKRNKYGKIDKAHKLEY